MYSTDFKYKIEETRSKKMHIIHAQNAENSFAEYKQNGGGGGSSFGFQPAESPPCPSPTDILNIPSPMITIVYFVCELFIVY